MRQKVYIILGPTSSGKTTLAINLCQKYNGEIISADSRQVYKHMDIGTNKTTSKKAKIWGYDLVNPDEPFSAYDFARYTLEKARDIIKRGKKVFIAGGTGFYIDIFTGKIEPSLIKPDPELREQLEKLSLEDLRAKLKNLSLEEFEKIDKNNTARLIRSIEKLVAKEKEEPLKYLENVEYIYIALTAERDILYKRVDSWAESIWEELQKEKENLIKLGYEGSPKLSGIVYKSASLQELKYDLHAYIRRQQTYFKKNTEIRWFNITDDNFEQNIYNLING